MKKYLEKRIENLKKVEMDYWDKQLYINEGSKLKIAVKSLINDLYIRRKECEHLLEVIDQGDVNCCNLAKADIKTKTLEKQIL